MILIVFIIFIRGLGSLSVWAEETPQDCSQLLAAKPRYVSSELWKLVNQKAEIAQRRGEKIAQLEWDKAVRQGRVKAPEGEAPYEPLKPEEREKLRREVEALWRAEARLKGPLSERSSQDAKILKTALSDTLEKDSDRAPYLKDYLRALHVFKLYPKRLVSILSGNLFEVNSPQQTQEILILIGKLLDDGYSILYDADTRLAPEILKFIKKRDTTRCIGITSKRTSSSDESSVLQIENDYLRMAALMHADRVIMTPDSITGLSVALCSRVTSILDIHHQWKNSLEDWSDKLMRDEISIGLKMHPVSVYDNAQDLLKSRRVRDGEKVYPWAGDSKYAPRITKYDLDQEDLYQLLEYTEAMVLAGQQFGGSMPGGSVIFGSGEPNPTFDGKVFRAAHALAEMGIPVWTGGADGVMRIANAGAYLAGGESVGIPIYGLNRLPSEQTIATDVQTQTLHTAGYESRIPLLLWNKQIVVMAPGRGGTLREIGVALMAMMTEPEFPRYLIFLDRAYYQGLLEALEEVSLPPWIRNRILLVDDAQGLETAIQRLIQEKKIRPELLFFREPQVRRELMIQQLGFAP